MIGIPAVMLAADVPVVHTTGVNWASVITIIGAIVVIMSAVFALLAWYVTTRITGGIDKFRIEVVDKLDSRLIKVETTLEVIRKQGSGRRLDERGGNYSTVYRGTGNPRSNHGSYYGA